MMLLKKISIAMISLFALSSPALSAESVPSLFKTNGYVYKGTISIVEGNKTKDLPVLVSFCTRSSDYIAVCNLKINDKKLEVRTMFSYEENTIKVEEGFDFGKEHDYAVNAEFTHNANKKEIEGELSTYNYSLSDAEFAKNLKDIGFDSEVAKEIKNAKIKLKLYQVVVTTKHVLVQ